MAKSLADALQKLANRAPKQPVEVEAGIFDKRVAEYAPYLEFGSTHTVTPKAHAWFKAQLGDNVPKIGTELVQPPRPFMRSTFAANREKWGKQLATQLKMRGKDGLTQRGVEDSLSALGLGMSSDIVQTLNDAGAGGEQFAPRTELTQRLYAAQRAGHKNDGTGNLTGAKPMKRTGDLIDSIGYRLNGKEINLLK